MDRTWQSAEFESWFVPYHQEVLRAHQSYFCLLVFAEDGGFQSDVSDIQTETEQVCQAELREWGNCRAVANVFLMYFAVFLIRTTLTVIIGNNCCKNKRNIH